MSCQEVEILAAKENLVEWDSIGLFLLIGGPRCFKQILLSIRKCIRQTVLTTTYTTISIDVFCLFFIIKRFSNIPFVPVKKRYDWMLILMLVAE